MKISDYIEATNSPEVRRLLTAAHDFLQETLPPFAVSGIKWRIPFFTLRRNFCYLNRHPDHITLGFPYGWLLAPKPRILLGANENLKRVRYLEIFNVRDLYSANVRRILNEAIILDEMTAKTRRGSGMKNAHLYR